MQNLPQTTPQPKRHRKPWTPGKPIPDKVRDEFDFPTPAPRPRAEVPKPSRGPSIKRPASSLFTMPDERRAMIEFAISDLRARGIAASSDKIELHGTSIDKNLNQAEYEALCWFLDVHTAIDTGIGAASSHESAYTYIVDRMPEPFLVFLDWVGRCQYPKRYGSGAPPSKLKMGRAMFAPKDPKYSRAGVDGYLQAVAQAIASLRGERDILVQRRELVRQEYASRPENLVNGRRRP